MKLLQLNLLCMYHQFTIKVFFCSFPVQHLMLPLWPFSAFAIFFMDTVAETVVHSTHNVKSKGLNPHLDYHCVKS